MHGIIAGLICIPGMLVSAWLFDVDLVLRIALRVCISPLILIKLYCQRRVRLRRRQTERRRMRMSATVAPAPPSGDEQTSGSIESGGQVSRMRIRWRARKDGGSNGSEIGSGSVGGNSHLYLWRKRRSEERAAGSSIGVVGICLGAIAGERRSHLVGNSFWARFLEYMRLPLGWLLNFALLIGLLFTFTLYVCEVKREGHLKHAITSACSLPRPLSQAV